MPSAPLPQYLRIHAELAADIARQGAGADERLPSERELAARFACTRITVREALQQLEAEGVISRENRRGWYVNPPRIRYNPTRIAGFMDFVAAQGRQPRTETLIAELRPAGPWLAQRMQLEVDAPVYHLTRRRWVDQRPVLLEVNAIDASWCPGLLDHDLDTSLTQLFRQRFQRAQTRSDIRLHSTIMPDLSSHWLQIAGGSPAVYIERLCYAEHPGAGGGTRERPVEFDQEFWRAEALEIELNTALDAVPAAAQRW